MKTIHFAMKGAALLILAAGLTGCMPRTPVLPYYGTLFNDTSTPVDITFESNAIGPARGKAAATSVLWLFSYGDCSVQSAARDGNLATVNHVDADVTNILFGLYTRYETVAWGEPQE